MGKTAILTVAHCWQGIGRTVQKVADYNCNCARDGAECCKPDFKCLAHQTGMATVYRLVAFEDTQCLAD